VTRAVTSPRAAGRPATTYGVVAVRYAERATTLDEVYYRWSSYGEPDGPLDMAYYFWILEPRTGPPIVVDSGFAPDVGARKGRPCSVEPAAALARLGIDGEEVQQVVVTHLHYDHIGNLAAFPEATLIVPRRELEFWSGPMGTRFQFGSHVERSEIEYVERAAAEGRVRLTEGTEEILDGVTAIAVGGHSPGQQITVVRSEGGDVLLASDAVHFYEELELERPFAVMHDLEGMYAAYDVLKEFAWGGAEVVPGHDPDVARRYPRVEAAGAVEAVRIG
jgi:glyoxylase-like metal-dependent hydrolase (beta-lactamase superfamily II)